MYRQQGNGWLRGAFLMCHLVTLSSTGFRFATVWPRMRRPTSFPHPRARCAAVSRLLLRLLLGRRERGTRLWFGLVCENGNSTFFVFSFPNRPCSVLLRILTNCFYHGLIAKDSNPSRWWWWWWDDEAKTLLVVVVVELRCNYRFHRICSRKALCPYSYMFL